MGNPVVYLTTPLYYVNAAPHIGHSYTEVAADCMARYRRGKGMETFLLTGTDEHGQKIEQAAAAAGKTPQAFVDEVVQHFKKLWQLLNIQYDDFIRTTEPRHIEAVQQILTKLRDRDALKRASYQGWYCTPDETFWTEAELNCDSGQSTPLCPQCRRPLEPVTEEGWHLPLREHQPWLKSFIAGHPEFIWPESRYNELKSLLEQPLPEFLSITRPQHRVKWGIPVPFDASHVVYVWIDALLNYITVPGYRGEDPPPSAFKRLWPAVHLIGKDILRHHALYWPILLHALGFKDEEMPRIVTHGWWKVGEQKMSKSLGNIVNPLVVIGECLKGQPFAADIYRYFLLREVPFGQDGAFSEDALMTRLNADLANDLGNLVNRTLSMIERYNQGRVPASAEQNEQDRDIAEQVEVTVRRVESAMEDMAFSQALEAIMQLVSKTNAYIEAVAPWKLFKQSEQARRLQAVLCVLANVVATVAVLLNPFMPSVSAEIWRQLGCGDRSRQLTADIAHLGQGVQLAGQRLGSHPVLFPRPEKKP